MGRKETVWGAFHIELDNEIKRVRDDLEKIGVQNPSKIEASAIIAKKSKSFKMNEIDAKKMIKEMRGLI